MTTRTDIDIESYKAKLENELSRLEAEMATLGRKNEATGDWDVVSDNTEISADPNDRGDRFEEIEDNAAILNELEAQYGDVKRALDKIEAGTYGFCEVANEPIETGRLDANPAARTCQKHMA
jgi:DnaK suppressor protein